MLLKPSPKPSQKPQWQFSTSTPTSQKPSHYDNPRGTLRSNGQGQKVFGEIFDHRSLHVPTLFKESVFVPKLNKFQLDPVPFIQTEREWDRSKKGKTLRNRSGESSRGGMHRSRSFAALEQQKTVSAAANGSAASDVIPISGVSNPNLSSVPNPNTSRRAVSSVGRLRELRNERRHSQPVIVRDKNISTRRSEWRKYRRSRDSIRTEVIQADYNATKPLSWNNGTSLYTHDVILMEEPVTLPSGRVRVQRRQRKISELDRIEFDNGHHSKLKQFKQRKYPSLLERTQKDLQKKRAVLEKKRRRDEEVVQFGGMLQEQQQKQLEAARPVWKQTLFVNQYELKQREVELLRRSTRNSRRKLKSASSAYSFRTFSRSSSRMEN